jgi:hypothetical protein
MRNILAILMLSAGAAWAAGQGPLVGPGVVGEKDEKGGVKGADAGAGPHLKFNQMQLERRVDRPEEAIAKEKKEKEEKARRETREEKSESVRGRSPN